MPYLIPESCPENEWNELLIVCRKTILRAVLIALRDPAFGGHPTQLMRDLVHGQVVDYPLRSRREGPAVGSLPEDLARSSVLMDDDFRDVIFAEIPDAPLPQLPAGRRQTRQIRLCDSVERAFIGTPHINPVILVRPEIELRHDAVGDAGGAVGHGRPQRELAARN